MLDAAAVTSWQRNQNIRRDLLRDSKFSTPLKGGFLIDFKSECVMRSLAGTYEATCDMRVVKRLPCAETGRSNSCSTTLHSNLYWSSPGRIFVTANIVYHHVSRERYVKYRFILATTTWSCAIDDITVWEIDIHRKAITIGATNLPLCLHLDWPTNPDGWRSRLRHTLIMMTDSVHDTRQLCPGWTYDPRVRAIPRQINDWYRSCWLKIMDRYP